MESKNGKEQKQILPQNCSRKRWEKCSIWHTNTVVLKIFLIKFDMLYWKSDRQMEENRSLIVIHLSLEGRKV